MIHRRWLLLTTAAFLLLITACGDDNGGEPAAREQPPATDQPGAPGPDVPDPCEFAPSAEVSAAIGTDMEGAGVGSGDFDGIVTETCAYRATSGEELFASVQVLGGFDDTDEVREAFARFGTVEAAGIEGLPDSTFVTDVGGFRTIFVLEADQPYGVNVSAGAGDEDRPEQAEQLARALYGRD